MGKIKLFKSPAFDQHNRQIDAEKNSEATASERPTPQYVDDPKLLEKISELRSHPEIDRLLELLWKKDPYTYFHCHRVGDLAQWVAHQMGMSPQESLEVYLTGLLHDIGKLLTPDFVLKKPGPLTHHEFARMKEHPSDSAKLVARIDDLGHLEDPILGHHERIDGKGYPFGKKGDEIHAYSKIILIADTFDAMTSNRPYRKGLDFEVAYEELERFSGTQFDGNLAKAFVERHRNAFHKLLQKIEDEKKVA